jgi:hypothetical protein
MKILNATWYIEMGEPKSIGVVIAEVEDLRNLNTLKYYAPNCL